LRHECLCTATTKYIRDYFGTIQTGPMTIKSDEATKNGRTLEQEAMDFGFGGARCADWAQCIWTAPLSN
jgi:hypothetical protein